MPYNQGDTNRKSLAIEKLDQVELYTFLSKLHETNRAGWVDRHIHNPERIMEHMYSCWLIGFIFLPDASRYEGYSKEVVLNTLLIHDLGESATGDIPKPIKALNPESYNALENEAMRKLITLGVQQDETSSVFLDYWEAWISESDINAKIAKDIDNIQAVHQYCRYTKDARCEKNLEDLSHWISELKSLRTVEGERIARLLVLDNPEFVEFVTASR